MLWYLSYDSRLLIIIIIIIVITIYLLFFYLSRQTWL